MKLIFILVGMLIKKIAVFVAQKTHTRSYKPMGLHALRVTVLFGLWSGGITGHFSLKMGDPLLLEIC